jgi:hypothetical protein
MDNDRKIRFERMLMLYGFEGTEKLLVDLFMQQTLFFRSVSKEGALEDLRRAVSRVAMRVCLIGPTVP